MAGMIITIILGVVCIVIGILNTQGNISTLHARHRRRVAEEDILPFGRLVGAGTIIIGGALIIGGIFLGLSELLENNMYANVGGGVLIAGFVVGLVISFIAMLKYNKGIF